MTNPILNRYLRTDGSFDLCAALCELRAGQTTSARMRTAIAYLAELEDLTPIRKPEAAAAAFIYANQLTQ